VAGAIAQAQRLQSETSDPVAAKRAADIETTLKRLTRLSEKLIQLARAEGGRLRTGKPADLRPVLRLVVSDFERTSWGSQIDFIPPDHQVISDIDPDAFGIVCRNLIENALKHGAPGSPVRIRLSASGRLSIENDSPAIEPEILARLTRRFERGTGSADGSGLGLAIVRTIAERANCRFELVSPIAGQTRGMEAAVVVPTISLQR
jgi:two-component system, OmpR family, sensor kinase